MQLYKMIEFISFMLTHRRHTIFVKKKVIEVGELTTLIKRIRFTSFTFRLMYLAILANNRS